MCHRSIYSDITKNVMVKSFFEQFGFRKLADSDDGSTEWRLETPQYAPRKVFIESNDL